MPIYEYECRQCGHELSKMQKFSDAQMTECPRCCGELKKLISNTSFVLKGGGWYSEGYTSCDNKRTAEPEKKPAAEAGECGASCSGECSAPAAQSEPSPSKKDAAA